jgi:5-methylcytosine-specific restriction endonuclease McrA
MAHNHYNNNTYKTNRKQLLTGNPPCHWCGGTATTADHIIEVDRGGTHELDNLVPACNPCNSRRGQAYRAQRDAQRKARREQATNNQTPFFTETLQTDRKSVV